jgi:hypothetical protein
MARMHRVIYRSRVARQVRFADAEAIARAAAERNQRVQITGLLLYTPSYFLQVLEGEQGAIRKTMQRIARDVRHADIQVLDEREVAAREFGNWGMAARFLGTQSDEIESLDGAGALELLRAQAVVESA